MRHIRSLPFPHNGCTLCEMGVGWTSKLQSKWLENCTAEPSCSAGSCGACTLPVRGVCLFTKPVEKTGSLWRSRRILQWFYACCKSEIRLRLRKVSGMDYRKIHTHRGIVSYNPHSVSQYNLKALGESMYCLCFHIHSGRPKCWGLGFVPSNILKTHWK